MKKKIKIITILSLVLFVISCCFYYNSKYYIEKHEWKNSNGATIGDFLIFNDSIYSMNNRKIYKYYTHVGYVVFCVENYLIVYSTKESGFGFYYKQ
jgi:hypothetical protein